MRCPLALVLLALTGYAQTFEVATVKVNKQPPFIPGGGGPGGPPPPPPPPAVFPSPTGLTITGVTLKYCMQWAYDLESWQVNGPDWIGSERYDIVARSSGPVEVKQIKTMLQALLSDRFRMTLHREKKDARVMAPIQAPGGARLKPAAAGRTLNIKATLIGDGRIRFEYTSAGMGVLEGLFTLPSGPPVVDMTGLAGTYDIVFERPAHLSDNVDAWSGDLRAAIEKQLGLRFEARRTPLEYLVIDRVEKIPVEN